MGEGLSYIADLVRREDRDRFLTALFVPSALREDVLALYAFNVELARIRQNVSETLIGQMKLQWWRDVISAIYEGRDAPKGNPVTESLAGCIRRHKLTRVHFDTILETREQEMRADDAGFMFTDVTGLEGYALGTSSTLIQLVLGILGADSPLTQGAARHVGIAVAFTGILRAVLIHAYDNRLYLPKAIVTGAGLSGVQDLQSQQNAKAAAKMIADIASVAMAHLDKARAAKVERAAVPALLGATIAEQYLKTLKAAAYDLSHPKPVVMRASVLRLTWNAWRGKF